MIRPGARARQYAYALYRRLETRRHELLYLFFEITRRCNLLCRHCGSDCTSDAPAAELTTHSWLNIAEYVASRFDPKPAVVITGGEPLVHPDLDRIAARINDVGLTWGMVTNGMLLTPERLSRLVHRGLSSITVSLDGGRAAHSYLRNSDIAFDRAVAAVRAVGASAIPTRDVVTCVFTENLSDLDQTAELLLNAGINSWRLFRIFPLGRAEGNRRLSLSFGQTHQLLRWIQANRSSLRAEGLSVSYSCEGYVPYHLDRGVRDEPFFCRSGINFASILSDGTITGCSNNDSPFHQGSLLRDDFATVWEHGFRNLRDRSWLKTGPCGDCREWRFCLGGSVHLRNAARVSKNCGPAFCYVRDIDA